jgi:hypothetical protein
LKKENLTMELIVQSCDELILEIDSEIRLDRIGEDDNKDKDDDDNDDGGDTAAPPTTAPLPAAAPPADATPATTALELDVEEEEEDLELLILEREPPKALEVTLPDEEPEPSQPHLFTVLMRDHEESPSRMCDDLDNPTLADYDVDEWFFEDGSRDRD